MIRSLIYLAATLVTAFALQPRAAAAAVTLRLGTIIPEGTAYHKSLLEMREKWRKAPGGGVDIRILAGGKAGGDAKMVSQMRLGGLDAAFLTVAGLVDIEKGVVGLQTAPMLFRTLDEVDHISEKLQPLLEQRMEKAGFVVLFWSDAGWVRFFTKTPATRPSEVQRMKLFTWAGDPAYTEIWKAAGFNPVPIETADIVPMLDTGLINAVSMPPFAALAIQINQRTPHMIDLNWAPLAGALVVRKAAWDKIPAEARAEVKKSALEAGRINKALGRAESEKAVDAMKSKGLTVHSITPAIEAEWRRVAESVYPKIRGKLVPEDVFDLVTQWVKEYRAAQSGAKP